MTAVGKLTGRLLVPSTRVRDGRFLDAVTAAAALVADSGGGAGPRREKRYLGLLGSLEDLQAYDRSLIANSFAVFADAIEARGSEGRSEALKAVCDVAGDQEGAETVLRIASAIAWAADPSQGQAVPDLRTRLEEIAAAAGLAADGTSTHSSGGPPGGCRPGRVITLGSPKGGTGKTTTAVHVTVGLIKQGRQAGSIDLDGAQGTMSRYFANRALLAREAGRDLGLPRHRRIEPSQQAERGRAEADEAARLAGALAELSDCDCVVIDTPGHDCHLSRLACAQADTLITPMNDSLIDIEILARIDSRKREVQGPSDYSKLVWEENDRRVASGRPPIDWIVMRNRLGHVEARNNREVQRLLEQLSQRMGFRLEHGLSERVAFREYFLEGLTLLDLPPARDGSAAQRSRVRARRELDDLLAAIRLEPVDAVGDGRPAPVAAASG